MAKKNAPHSEQFKVKVVLEALKGLKTQQQLAAEFGIHPVQLTQWKTQFLDGVASVFSKGHTKKDSDEQAEKAQLYEKIGRLEMENDWLKKNWSAELRREAADDQQRAYVEYPPSMRVVGPLP